ncbi:unnamed protein product [Clonostachys chloroleuca]|uniref:Uncharacterized protein n=1 Tax=Clonostachys chloroleuca TaxID=1926264 RepID=A0AA35MJW5_9HYPO|nr:unnamed protein product [Clonostachys chloroleuca]
MIPDRINIQTLSQIELEDTATESTPLEPASIPKSHPTTETVPSVDSIIEEPRAILQGSERKGINVPKHILARFKDKAPALMEACYVVALGKWESERYWSNFWYHGDKIRREPLIESLKGRTNEEIRCIKRGFLDRKYDNGLERCLKSELEEIKFKKAVFLVLQKRQMEEFDSSG